MNWKQAIMNVATLLFCFVMQFSFPSLRLFGAAPNWLFCFAVCLAVSEPSVVVSVIFSVIAGLLCDFSSNMFFGHNTFWFIAVSYLSVFFIRKLFSRNIKTTVVIFSVGFLVIKVGYYFLYSFVGENFSFFRALWSDFLPSFGISLPILAVLYLLYSRFYYKNPDIRISRKAGFGK